MHANKIKEVISTSLAPAAIGTYSQAIKAGNTVYISGQIGFDPTAMQLMNDTIDAEIHQMFRNMQAIAIMAKGTLEHVVKLTIYLTDMTHFPRVNEIMTEYFHEPYPARATIEVSGLPKTARVEADAIMILPQGENA